MCIITNYKYKYSTIADADIWNLKLHVCDQKESEKHSNSIFASMSHLESAVNSTTYSIFWTCQ